MDTTQSQVHSTEAWPRLPLDAWQPTYATLHLLTQMVGKTRLGLAPPQNHCWHVALYLTARGLSTSPMPCRERTLEVEFDFIDHVLNARTSDGATRTLPLAPQAVANFYAAYRAMLHALDIEVGIWPMPSEIANAIPFTQDRVHASYDANAARDCWRVLVQVDRVLKAFRGRFVGKSSPVHFWWGAFDLACTRFSGRRAPTHPGGFPTLPDTVTRDAYSHECISAGWWPGNAGGPVEEPAFYAYAYPEPPGFAEVQVGPAAAHYHPTLHEWVLPYDAVRTAPDPDATLLAFLQDTYAGAAGLAAWDRAQLERPSDPSRSPPQT